MAAVSINRHYAPEALDGYLARVIRIVDGSSTDVFGLLAKREIFRDESTVWIVREILEDVRARGDDALLDSARQFDSPEVYEVRASQSELSARCTHDEIRAIEFAYDRIRAFHEEQLSRLMYGIAETSTGHEWSRKGIGQRILPLKSVGVYVPGGRATYPSSVLMNAVPAACAGVDRIYVASPAQAGGSLAAPVGRAALLCGVDSVFKVGGAAAIAAFAYGTESVPRVDKIVGPGNRFVNEAKRQVWGSVGLDGYAGPSDVAVLTDDSADAKLAAADLLTQIEHAEDNAGFLICLSQEKLQEILFAVRALLEGSPRKDVMAAALQKESLGIVASDLAQACDIVNAIAPEHLTVMTSEPHRTVERIHNAGCILLGDSTPESAADWAIGPSHTIPTAGGSRFDSPVNVLTFLKFQSMSSLNLEELSELLPTINAFGNMEGFAMHSMAANLRFEE